MKNTHVKVQLLLAALATLGGCTRTASVPDVIRPVMVRVDKSVAKKVLGHDAISADPFSEGEEITTPGIYRIVENSDGSSEFYKICENDTSQQNSIRYMRNEVTKRTNIVEDSLYPITLSVTLLGQELSQPYSKIKVSGYSVKRVYSGDSGSPEDWILSHVATKCDHEVLPENTPFLIVTAVATADNVETVTGGGLAKTNFAVGIVGVHTEAIRPTAESRVANRVFAVRGKMFTTYPRKNSSNKTEL